MRTLAVRIGRAGDIVMTTPALETLLEAFPEARMTMLTSKDGRRLLNGYHPRLDTIWVYNRSGLGPYFAAKDLKRKISAAGFDSAYCFDSSRSIRALLRGVVRNLHTLPDPTTPVHCARHYLDLVEQTLGRPVSTRPVRLPVSAEAIAGVHDELARHGIGEKHYLIGIHPTYSGYSRVFRNRQHIHKMWPAERFAELCRRLQDSNPARPTRIIMDLLPHERQIGERILRQAGNAVTMLTEAPNIERYKALLRRLNLFVTPDTGPMHIAAAMGTEMVTLFSGHDPRDCGPYMDPSKFTILQAEKFPGTRPGIANIEVDAVYQACTGRINGHRPAA